MVKPVQTSKESSKRIFTVGDERNKYVDLTNEFSEVFEGFKDKNIKATVSLRHYPAILIKAVLSQDEGNKLYEQCSIFLDESKKLMDLLSTLHDIHEKIMNMMDQSPNDPHIHLKIENPRIKDEKPYNYEDTTLVDLKRALCQYIKYDSEIEEICSILTDNGLQAEPNMTEIKGEDVPRTIFRLLQYCKGREQIPLLMSVISEYKGIPENIIISKIQSSKVSYLKTQSSNVSNSDDYEEQ